MKNSDRVKITISKKTNLIMSNLENSNQLLQIALVSVEEQRISFYREINVQQDSIFKCVLLSSHLPVMVLDGTPSKTSFLPWVYDRVPINMIPNIDRYCTKSVECYTRLYHEKLYTEEKKIDFFNMLHLLRQCVGGLPIQTICIPVVMDTSCIIKLLSSTPLDVFSDTHP
jgi:hypothetical protein